MKGPLPPSDRERDESDRAERLFAEALTLPPEARAGFIASVCGDHAELRAELDSLLAHAAGGEQLFERMARLIDRIDIPPTFSGGRYELVEWIATGGMGTVYRARDTQLERDVALKFLPSVLASAPDGAQQLLREARAAAALEHPNVCVVHEVATNDEGRPFIAMAFYEGETLKERVARGPLPIGDAVGVAVQIARGLAAAHALGIVHRDVKPGNIMLTADGTVKLLDFGLAKAADVSLTRPGLTPGTVAYMSPEQARGEPVGARSDLWSLGIVLYEILAGTQPFRGGSDRIVIDAIQHTAPDALRTRVPAVPVWLERIVDRLLQKEESARYADADSLLRDLTAGFASPSIAGGHAQPWMLRWMRRDASLPVLGSAVVLLAAGLAWWTARGRPTAAPTTDSPERVLVADFAGATSDSTLGDLVAEALRSELARSPVLHVAGRASITETLHRMRLEPGTPLRGDLARELAIREEIKVVVEGDIRAVGSGFILSASVVEAQSGDIIHGLAETAADSTGILAAIERISDVIRQALGATVTSVSNGDTLWSFTTSSLAALRKHVAGSRALHRGDYATAAALFQEAVALDPEFGHAHLLLFFVLLAGGQPAGRALPHLLRAYEIRDQLTDRERYAVEGNYHVYVTGDLEAALGAFQRHMAELVRYPSGEAGWYATYGAALALAGDLATAERVLQQARDRFPTGANQTTLVSVLLGAGNEAEAGRVLREARRRFPAHPGLQALEARMLASAGRMEDAHTLATRMSPVSSLPVQADVDASRGRIHEAITHLAELRDRMLELGNPPVAFETAIAMGRLRMVLADADVTRDVDTLLATIALDTVDVLSRPYLPLTLFYAEAGQPERARAWLMAYERDFPLSYRGANRPLLHLARAAVSLAEGHPDAALSELRRPTDPPALLVGAYDDARIPMRARPELARVYEQLRDADSAIAVYERYLTSHPIARTRTDAFELGNVLEHLARLHVERGNGTRAAELYLRLADQWRAADPPLLARAAAARQSAASLRPTAGPY